MCYDIIKILRNQRRINLKNQVSLKLNFFMNIILTLSSIIFPLITFPYVSRILQPEAWGKVNMAISFITYFSYFAQLGLPTYGVKICAQYRDNREKLSRTVQELSIICAIATLITYIALAIVITSIPMLYAEKNLYLLVSSTLFFNLIGMEWLYKALEKYTYITFRSIIFKIIALIAMFLLIKSESDYIIYGGISVFASSASNICNFIEAKKYVSFKPLGNYNFKQHLKPLFILFAMTCASTIYTNLDTVMLGFMTTNTDVGYYNAAIKIKSLLVAVVTSLSTVLLPRASYYIENDLFTEFKKISSKALNFIFIIALPMILYFIVFARECIFFLSGDKFEASIIPMQIIMPTLLFIGLTNILGIQILIPLGKEKYVLYSTIAGAVTDLILNTILIPSYKSCGAAVGTLVAELVVLIVQLILIGKDIRRMFRSFQFSKMFFASAIALLCTYQIKNTSLHVFFILIISAIIFFGIYGLLLILFKEPFTCEIKNNILNKLMKKSKPDT